MYLYGEKGQKIRPSVKEGLGHKIREGYSDEEEKRDCAIQGWHIALIILIILVVAWIVLMCMGDKKKMLM